MLGSWFGKRNRPQKYAERDTSGDWLVYFNQYAQSDAPKKFSPDEAFSLAGSIAEIFYPIDMIADACSSLEYDVVDAKTLLPVDFGSANFKKLFENPNPYSKFSDLVYQGIFNKFSDGNCYDYTKIPDSYRNPNFDNITNIWTLSPDVTKPELKKAIPNPWSVKEKNDLIESYKTFFFYKHSIDPRYIKHNTLFEIERNGKGRSPLMAVEKNINNLLAVYSARLNVYEKNMNGGILSADTKGGSDVMAQVDPIEREKIMKDLKDRNGLTGNKNFVGISSIPLKFIKTIGTIKELEPFDETEVDAMAIASIFGLDSDLVPKRAPSKYSNKIDGERKLWQTVIKSVAIERGVELAQAYYLPDGLVFYPNFQNVEILQEDKKTSYDADKVLIENLVSLKENGVAVEENFKKIKDKYDSI